MSSSATGVGMTICFLGAILLILTQKSSQKFGDVLGIISLHSFALHTTHAMPKYQHAPKYYIDYGDKKKHLFLLRF